LSPRSGAPVTPRVARLVIVFTAVPAVVEAAKDSVGACIRKFLSVEIPVALSMFKAWVLVRARLKFMSGASVEAVRPVSAALVKVMYGVTPDVRAMGVRETVPVAVKVPPRKVLPAISRRVVGEVVPMPTFPVAPWTTR